MKPIAILLLLTVSVYGEIIPATNAPVAVWAVAGVPGGIPSRSTSLDASNALNGIDITGVTNATTKIAAAIVACTAGQAVQLPAGTLLIGNPLSFTKSQISVRGTVMNGTNATILKLPVTSNITFNANPGGQNTSDNAWLYTNAVIYAPQGATNIALSTVTTNYRNFSVGSFVCIDQTNTDWITFYGTGGGTTATSNANSSSSQMGKNYLSNERLRMHYAKVVAVASGQSNITIWPPLPFGFDTNGNAPQIYKAKKSGNTWPMELSGLEDVTIDCSNYTGTAAIQVFGTYACWLKNVEVYGWYTGEAVWAKKNASFEMRHCWLHDPRAYANSADYGYGLLLESTSGALIIDNITFDLSSNILLQNGVAGGVIAYNAFVMSHYRTTPTFMQHEISGNHTPFPAYNLFEGNYTGQFQSDYYYGPSGFTTLFRNRIPGRSVTPTDRFMAVSIDSFNRYYSVVGNSLGTTNAETGTITLALPAVTNSFADTSLLSWTYDEGTNTTAFSTALPHIYRLGYPRSGDNASSSGTQVHDQFVKTNTLRHGNWDAVSNVVWDAGIADHTISNSLIYSAAPYFFGTNHPWPPYGYDIPSTNMVKDLERIPAGWKLLYGTNQPYGELAVSTNLLDWGVLTQTSNNHPKSVTFSNLGSAPISVTWNAAAPFTVVWGGYSNYIPANSSVTMSIDYEMEHRGLAENGLVQTASFVFQGGGKQVINCKAVTTYDPLGGYHGNMASFNSGVAKDFTFLDTYIKAADDTIPFVPNQSGEAYLGFTLTNRSIVTFTASVQATNASDDSFAVEIDGEPVEPNSVWDLTATSASFETQTLNLRGVGSATAPDEPAKPWLLDAGTHYVKVVSRKANTKLASLTANVIPILPVTTFSGSGSFSGGSFQ